MVNKVLLIGRLGADPEIRYTAGGDAVANLRVATDESYTDRSGNKVENTEWHRVVVFQRQAENCQTYLRKGSMVYIEGSLRTRKWEDKDGQSRYTTEIRAQRVQFLDRKQDRFQDESRGSDYQNDARQRPAPRGAGPNRGNRASDMDSQDFPDDMAYGSEAMTDNVPF